MLAKGTVAAKAGTVTSVALLGGAGAPRELYAFSDAGGSRAAPTGGIRTGAGGTVPFSPTWSTPTGTGPAEADAVPTLFRSASALAPLALLAALVAGAMAMWRRSRAGAMPAATRARARQQTLALLAAGLVLALGGCAGPATPAADPTMPAPGSFDAPASPPTAPGFDRRPAQGDRSRAAHGGAPRAPRHPRDRRGDLSGRLGLDPGGAMAVPADFTQAGWFAEGPAPGQLGPAVIAGHVDSRTGPAVFYRLRDLRPGDHIAVRRADGTRLRFVVEHARSYPKTRFPTAAVFGPVPSAALRLITCAGDFDQARGSYRDNLVVFARLAPSTSEGNRG